MKSGYRLGVGGLLWLFSLPALAQPPDEEELAPPTPPADLAPAQEEVLWRDSFEEGEQDRPAQWHVWSQPAPPAEWAWTGRPVHSGRRAVKLRGTGDPNHWRHVGWLGRDFAVEPGFVYLLRAWARTHEATGHTYLTIAWFDRNWEWLGNAPRSFVLEGTLDWTPLLCLGIPPEGAVRGLPHLRSDANLGRAWFDDAELTRTRQGIVEIPVPNASFETGSEDRADAWATLGQGTFARHHGPARDGAYTVEIAQSEWGTSWHSLGFDVNTPSPWRVWYRASAWAHPVAATGHNRVALAWFDPTQWLGNVEGADLPAADGDWFPLTVTGAAPPQALWAQIHLRADANRGRVWFDTVKLEVLFVPTGKGWKEK